MTVRVEIAPSEPVDALAYFRGKGLADALLMLGLRYGSDEAAAQTEEWMKQIAHAAYRASVDLAKERGAFPLFDADALKET